MICLRCGYCCTHYTVVIVVDPDLPLEGDNLRAINQLEEPCPHLEKLTEGYSCKIHDHPIYRETPCYRHEQIGRADEPCRIGQYEIGKGGKL